MKQWSKIAISTTAAALCTAYLLAQAPQAPQDEKAKAKAERKAQDIARAFELNARTFTLFDRKGNQLKTVGARGMYGPVVFSPEAKKIAFAKTDLQKENQDLWVMDLAGGEAVQLTHAGTREFVSAPVWSPDGSQIAYTALRSGNFGVYRISPDGKGSEELIYKLPGITAVTDWSKDGRFLSLSSSDLGGGILSALPVTGTGERKAIEYYKSAKQLNASRLSPDGRLIAYSSNETGKNEMYIRGFDPIAGSGAGGPWKISDQGVLGAGGFWREDGKEFYFLAADRNIMAVPVTTSPAIAFGKATVLFHIPDAFGNAAGDISGKGDLMVMAVPPPQLRQLTIYDRTGKPVRSIGDPGNVVQPHFSPDGTKIVFMKTDLKTADLDIWSLDLETGKEYQVTKDSWPENGPIWSKDGKRVMYASTRDNYAGIYRKNWDGTGQEELLFRYTPGAGITMTDATQDEKYALFYTGVLVLAPLTGGDALSRKGIDWLRDEYDVAGGKFSPDGHYVAYVSNVDDPMALDIYVRPFEEGKAEAKGDALPPPAVQVTKGGVAAGMIAWRKDGKEFYYMTRDFEVMAMDVTTTPSFQITGTAKLLFKLPVPPQGNALQWDNVSPDGQRFIFSMPPR